MHLLLWLWYMCDNTLRKCPDIENNGLYRGNAVFFASASSVIFAHNDTLCLLFTSYIYYYIFNAPQKTAVPISAETFTQFSSI